jgi:hypothetical protein
MYTLKGAYCPVCEDEMHTEADISAHKFICEWPQITNIPPDPYAAKAVRDQEAKFNGTGDGLEF